MKKLLTLLILVLVTQLAFAKGPWIMGDPIKALKDNVKMKNGVSRLSGVLDPSATAVDAEKGSLYQSTLTGKTYAKGDSGSTTNWLPLTDEASAKAESLKMLQAAQGSGIISGCSINTSTIGTATLELDACMVRVVNNYTDPLNPDVVVLSWAPQSIPIPNIATQDVSVLTVDKTGTFSLTAISAPTSVEMRDNVTIGSVVHTNRTTVSLINDQAFSPGNDIGMALADHREVFGSVNYKGNVFTSNTALKLQLTPGTIFGFGINSKVGGKSENFLPTDACPGGGDCTWVYTYRDGLGGWTNVPGVTDAVPGLYDDGSGTLAAVPPNQFSIQRYYLAGEILVAQYGQKLYSTLSAALADVGSEIESVNPSIDQTTVIGWVVLKGNDTTIPSNQIETARPNSIGASGEGVTFNAYTAIEVNPAGNPNLITTCNNIILADATTGAVTVTLPDSAVSNANCTNKIYLYNNTNPVTVTTVGGTQNIGTTPTQVLNEVDQVFEVFSYPSGNKYLIIQDSRKPYDTDVNDNITTHADTRTGAIYGDYTDPFHFKVQDGVNYNATDSSLVGGASVDDTPVSFKLRPAVLTMSGSATDSLMAFDSVTNPQLLKEAWTAVYIRYGISGATTDATEYVQCSVYDNNVKIPGQYEPKLKKTNNQTQLAKIQFQMPASITKLQVKCEQLALTTETFTVTEITWSDKPEDQVAVENNTGWEKYNPTTQGLGSLGSSSLYSRRDGSDLLIQGSIVVGTTEPSEARLYLPDTSLLAKTVDQKTVAGRVDRGAVFGTDADYVTKYNSGNNYLTFGVKNSAYNVATDLNGNLLFSSGERIHINARIPIQGWAASGSAIIGQGEVGLDAFTWPQYDISSQLTMGTATFPLAVATPYKDKNGNWRMVFNIKADSSGSGLTSAALTGVTFSGSASEDIPITALYDTTGVGAGYVRGGTNLISINAGVGYSRLAFSGDVSITGQPSWATDITIGGPKTVLAKSAVITQEDTKASSFPSSYTANTPIVASVLDFGTGYNVSTGQYTVKADGLLDVAIGYQGNITAYQSFTVYVNGAARKLLTRSTVTNQAAGSVEIKVNKDDLVDVRAAAGWTSATGTENFISFTEDSKETGFVALAASTLDYRTNETKLPQKHNGCNLYQKVYNFSGLTTGTNTIDSSLTYATITPRNGWATEGTFWASTIYHESTSNFQRLTVDSGGVRIVLGGTAYTSGNALIEYTKNSECP